MSLSPLRAGGYRPQQTAAARLASLARTLLVRVLALQLHRYFRSYLYQWRLAARVASMLRKTAVKKPAEVARHPANAKGKIQPPKVEIKSVREPKSEPSTSPTVSMKKLTLTAAVKLATKAMRTVKPAGKSDSAVVESKDVPSETRKSETTQYKRPTSVPPAREEEGRMAGTNSCIIEETSAVLSSTLKTPRGKSAQRTTPDVCTRLFNEAQERENKRAEMRKSLEPDYSFTPRLALGTNKWLSQKSAKSTPMKTRNKVEEVAVVSSAAALSSLGRIGEMAAPKVRDTLRVSKLRGDKNSRGPIVPLMPHETLMEEVEELMSEDHWGKKTSPFSLTYSPEELAGQYASFGMQARRQEIRSISPIHKGASPNSPSFLRKNSLDEKADVFIDFTGEESAECSFTSSEKPALLP